MRVVEIGHRDESRFAPLLRALERGVSYPLGADRFEIDHGEDPFRFFRRLGAPRTFAALDGDVLAGVLTGVRRLLKTRGGEPRPAWYLCDLKAAPGRRAGRVLGPLAAAFARACEAPRAAYGISMDAADGSNRLARVLPRRFPGLRAAGRLRLFSLDAAEARRAAPLLAGPVGSPPTWLSLAGVKDIVLESTGRPMPLLHAQRGPLAASGTPAPVEGAVHMFCLAEPDPLLERLLDVGLAPSASATVLARGLEDVAFDFVLTSDI